MRFSWTIDPAEAQRFQRHETAIEIAQMVKHAHPNDTVRLMEFPTEVSHDANS